MPPTRRGRGRGLGSSGLPGELRGTLGTLLRTTLQQASTLRDALERGAREGRARLEDVRLERRRAEALAALGAAVLERFRAGDLPELEDAPEIVEAIAAVEELDAAIEDEQEEAEPVRPARRDRFDRGPRPAARAVRRDDDPPWQRVKDAATDDGTVSSASWRPPAATPLTKKGPARVWRPPPDLPDADAAAEEPPPPPPRRGGIVFHEPPDPAGDGSDPDEDDLAAYMHPDDVPPRGRDES